VLVMRVESGFTLRKACRQNNGNRRMLLRVLPLARERISPRLDELAASLRKEAQQISGPRRGEK